MTRHSPKSYSRSASLSMPSVNTQSLTRRVGEFDGGDLSAPTSSTSYLRKFISEWDRSGNVYIEAFQLRMRPDILCEFFWRLNFLSPVDRGYDTTVTPVMNDDGVAKATLSKLRTRRRMSRDSQPSQIPGLRRSRYQWEFRSYIISVAV